MVRSHWSLQKLMSSATRSLFVEASLLQRCEVRGTQGADADEHNVLMMKDARCRQKESITQPVDEPALSCHSLASLALSCHSRHHQPAFCHRRQKKAIGSILFAKYNLFQPTQVRSLLCLAFSVTQSVRVYFILQANLKLAHYLLHVFLALCQTKQK